MYFNKYNVSVLCIQTVIFILNPKKTQVLYGGTYHMSCVSFWLSIYICVEHFYLHFKINLHNYICCESILKTCVESCK